MSADLPHSLYLGRDGKQGKGTQVTEDVVERQKEANRKARERRLAERQSRGEAVSVNELFNE